MLGLLDVPHLRISILAGQNKPFRCCALALVNSFFCIYVVSVNTSDIKQGLSTGQLTSLGLHRRSAIAPARGQSLGVRFTEFTNSLHIAVSPEKSFQRFPLKDDLVQRCRDKKKKAHLQSPEPSVPRSRKSREVPPSSILSSQNHSRCSSDTWEKTSVNIWS